MPTLNVAMIIPDNRDEDGHYDLPDPVFGPGPAALFEGFVTLPDVHLHIISCNKRFLPGPRQVAKNITYHPLEVSHWNRLRTGYWGCVQACRRKIRELKPDVVHGSGTERYAALAAAFSGRPNVITIRGNMRSLARLYRAPTFSYYGLSGLLETRAVRQTGGVVCLSRYTEDNVRHMARRTWLVPNAVPSVFFDVKRIPDAVPLLLFPASVASHKNQNVLIRALDSVAKRHDFKVLFVGSKPDPAGDAYVAEFDALLCDRPWCNYGGLVSREALRGLLGRATAVLLPSREDNCPNVVLEAMAAGVPVVAARIGGIPDLIEHDQSGLLVDPLNPDDMANAIERLLSNPADAARFAAVARQESEQYRPAVIAGHHVILYRELSQMGRS